MSVFSGLPTVIAPEQQALRDKFYHRPCTFIDFRKEESEQFITNRCEEQVRKYPDRLAVANGVSSLTYRTSNGQANRVARALLALR